MTANLSEDVLKYMGFEPGFEDDSHYFKKDGIVIHKDLDIYSAQDKHKKIVMLETDEDVMIFMSRNKDYIVKIEGDTVGDFTFSVNADSHKQAEKIVMHYVNENPEKVGFSKQEDLLKAELKETRIDVYKPKRDEQCARVHISDKEAQDLMNKYE